MNAQYLCCGIQSRQRTTNYEKQIFKIGVFQ